MDEGICRQSKEDSFLWYYAGFHPFVLENKNQIAWKKQNFARFCHKKHKFLVAQVGTTHCSVASLTSIAAGGNRNHYMINSSLVLHYT